MSLADEIAANDLWNPYDFANPVDDRRLFAGRAPELKDIRYYLRRLSKAPRPINLVLTGPRSAGKTSLLNWIGQEAREGGSCVARVELNEGDTNPFALFYKIYDAIVFAAASEGAFAGLSGQTYDNYRATMDGGESRESELLFPRHYTTASENGRPLSEPTLKRDLDTISAELQRPIVVLFDECDVLSTSRIELEMVRNVFMNTHGYMLVFAGTPNLFPVMEDVFSPIVRQFKKVPVERFTDLDDTVECITKPLRGIGVNPDQVLKPSVYALATEVDRLSAGRPYEIQLLCHFMFKRVEDGDASDLAITLDVLDDVRVELEKQESGTGRRTLSELPNLDTEDFRLLQALTEFEGTVEELALRSQVFGDQFDTPTLEAAFDRLSSLGFVKRDADGIVAFNGDQFDEVYARYYAAANDARLFIWKGNFWGDFRSSIIRMADRVAGVEPIYPSEIGTLDAKRRIQEALSALIEDTQLPLSTLPDVAADLYADVLEAHGRGSLAIAAVRFSALGSSYTQWLVLKEGGADAFVANPAFVSLDARAQGAGVGVDVEIFEYDLGPREDFVNRVLTLASRNQRERFGDQHYNAGLDAYVAGEYSVALQEFMYAMEFEAEAVHATSVAHVSLVLGRCDVALNYAETARDLALKEENLEQYVFASYDAAVASVVLGSPETAILLLDECEGALEVLPDDLGGFLTAPRLGEEGLEAALIADDQIQLVDAIRDLREFINRV